MSTPPDSPVLPENSGALSASPPPLPEEQLPEYEPLTPELVEDEAVRGDFVIRWATVLLALLLGWTQIDDTSLLVRIRHGQQSLLPYGVDTFSASAGDRSWVNIGWLSDPVLAGVYGVLGARGLTILGAVVSAITFWLLSRICVKGVSTWWGSVCGALALIAVFPQLIPGPTGLTLLGVTLVVFQLHRWSENRSAGFVWQIPVTILVWSQLDPRAWLGAAIVLAYALSWVGLRGVEAGDSPDTVKSLGKITGASLIAWLLHPMHYHVLLSPLTAYRTEYPELRAYSLFDWPYVWQWYPVFSKEFQNRLDLFSVVSLGLCVLALLTCALNFKRLTWEWLLPWVVVVALAALCAHQLPVAALLSVALITLNAQLWYRGMFSQKYTLDAMPLAWNRGGRAITVVLLLLLGLVASNGMLMGRGGRRIGTGFSPQLLASISGAEKLAKEVASPEVFNFRLDQGDLLIWAGLKPYADRRLTLYASGGENLLARHRLLRESLRLPNPQTPSSGKPEVWKPEFARLHINQAIPRLSGPAPDYRTLIEMLSQGWSMTSLQSFGAVLSRTDSPDEAFTQYRLTHPDVSYVKQAFQTEAPKTPLTDGPWIFPRRPTVYDTYLWQPQTALNEPLQLASHENALVQLFSAISDKSPELVMDTTALALSAYRHARQGIILDPQSVQGYRILGQSAMFLHRIESSIASDFRTPYRGNFWITQVLQSYHHLLQLNPDIAEVHEELASLQMQMGKPDLALEHLRQVYRLKGAYTTYALTDPQYEQSVKQNTKAVTELKRHVKTVEEAVLKAPLSGGDWKGSLDAAINGNCSGIALRVLEENRAEVAKDVRYQLLRLELLSVVGRTEDALQEAESLNTMFTKSPEFNATQPLSVTQVRQMLALNGLAIGDNAQLETLFRKDSQLVAESTMRGVLEQVSLVSLPGIRLDLMPASQGATAYEALYLAPERWANVEFMLAQSELSTWHNAAAKTRLTALLEAEPNVSLRPLIALYLELLTGLPQQPFTPEQQAAMEREAARGPTPRIGPAVAPAVGTPKTPPAKPLKTPDTNPTVPPPPPTATPSTPVKEPTPK